MSDASAPTPWADAVQGAMLLAVDPLGLGGIVLRAGAGPARDAWLDGLREILPPGTPWRRCPPHIPDDRLLGGLDLAGSLAAGRAVASPGLLAEADGGLVILPMAERLSDATAARIAATLDAQDVAVERSGLALRLSARIAIVALDEGVGPDERAPAALLERCAFHVDAGPARLGDLLAMAAESADVARAQQVRRRMAPVADALIVSVCEAAVALGVESARAPLFAVRAACAAAALDGRSDVTVEDIALAARLVLAPRATRAPAEDVAPDPADDEDAADAADPPEADADAPHAEAPPIDMVIAAARAALPDAVLDAARAQGRARMSRAHAGGGGDRIVSPHRGRPVGSRAGALCAGERLNIAETLRAAAPWQKLRGATGRVAVRREDFRVRRFVEHRDSTTIVVVDASGSAAFQRLAEAKGAVELLLANAYVSRTRVALVSFRQTAAEVLLPPTRSLARARKLLADLPGGGGTPLANGIEAAFLLAQAEKAKGRTPLLLFLTDGRANITRAGALGRAQAEADALQVAAFVRGAGFAAIHVDTSARPGPGAEKLAHAMGARYAPLPYLDARAVLGLAQSSPSAAS
ncbi:MAG: magnesium chelatase subunit D [Hyphomonadaceae bacterium]|nr:magnesium chelatase subunit D [Hyphomonadaceae bacterium]